MRIGFDIAQTCLQRAGCAWYADSLARALIEVAPENKYFLYHQFGRWINDDISKGTFIKHRSVEMPFWGVAAADARRYWTGRTPEEKLPGEPEIVQSNSFQAPATSGAKLVFVIYDTSFWIYPEFTTEANRLNCQYGVLEAMERADGFLFISESGRTEFETLFPGWLERNRKPSAAIPLASRIQPPENSSPAERHWLAVGSMEPRKNYDTLFTAIDRYWVESKNPSPLWIAAGAGWLNEKSRKRASDLETQGRIRVLGYVDEEHLAALYQQALGFIFPSWYEGFGLPVLEAMQCGCPVISSNRTSLPEVAGDTALYVDPDNPAEIAQAMIRLEGEPLLRARCREAGLRRAREFSWNRTAKTTLAFYREVLESHS